MVCHITEGELRVVQEDKTFTAKKHFVWTCNKDTKEQSFNDGTVVAIMRITDLKA
jgi:predicted nucleic acid-binding protein